MTVARILLIGALALSYTSLPVGAQQQERLQQYVQQLASEETLGRAPGTDGIEKAAAYIMSNFERLRLTPVGDQGTYRNTFTITSRADLDGANSVTFDVRRERPGVPIDKVRPTKMPWKLGVDYQPFSFSDTGMVSGRVVFCGYGIEPHGMDYSDYKGIDVKGAVVIVLRGLPKWAENDAHLKPLGSLRSKTTLAREKGAAAICFVNEKGDSSDVLDRFGVDRLGKSAGIMAVQVRRTPCAKVFPASVTTLFAAEEQINTSRKPLSYELPHTAATLETHIRFTESPTSNLIGMVKGTDPALQREFIVVGAHYDHLGMGDENSRATTSEPAIHYGADDNASGTAGVLELAERLSANPPKRSVVFMAYTAEEKGLLGSKHWVSTPTLPLENIVAMVNMDMIGRLKDNKLNVHGVGTSPAWTTTISAATEGTGLNVSTTSDGFGPSDHASFTPKKIPVLHFFTGLHTDYHRPSDTWDKLNFEGLASIVDVVERTVRITADADQRLAFTEGAEKPKAQATGGGFKVSLGIIPDYADDPNGLRVDGVRENTPASKAGMEDGDIITKIGSTAIKNIYDLTAFLGSATPGDEVEIVVLRGGKEVRLKTTLTGR